MTKIVKISIVIPVYNCETYLEICLNSLQNQLFTDFEVICINDGSTDNSLKVLHKFENIIPNLKIVSYKNNKGPSYARNIGIKLAIGKYIVFIDADDFIEQNTLSKTYELLKRDNFDAVVFGINIYNSNTGKTPIVQLKKKVYSDNSVMDILYTNNNWGVCNCIFKKDIIDREGILFNENIQDGEDRLFLNCLVPNFRNVITIPEILYNYRDDGQVSITNCNRDNFERLTYFIMVTEATINYWKKFDNILNYRSNFISRTIWLMMVDDIFTKLSKNNQIIVAKKIIEIFNCDFFDEFNYKELSSENIDFLNLCCKITKLNINFLEVK